MTLPIPVLDETPAFGEQQPASPAGFPIPHTDSANTSIDLNRLLLVNAHASYLFRVSGNAMSGIGIFEGDRVVVDRSLEPRHGHIVLAVVNGEFMIRRFFKKGGQVRLLAEDPACPPVLPTAADSLDIWGVVTVSLRKLA